MKKKRPIIEIAEEKCDGCGNCILACQEGALKLVNGKARLVGEVLCDGLGACIGECPQGALTISEREAEEFDEKAVEEHLAAQPKAEAACEDEGGTLACGCPSSESMELNTQSTALHSEDSEEDGKDEQSQLAHWPIKLKLIPPDAPFLKGKDLVLLADCSAAAFPPLHRKLLSGRSVAMGCPKFDDLEEHIEKLAEFFRRSELNSVTVVHMEVPCCKGFVYAAEKALERSGVDLEVINMKVSRDGVVLEEYQSKAGARSAAL
ncbi:MAG: 4Fe-4S binding protein [bacterium]